MPRGGPEAGGQEGHAVPRGGPEALLSAILSQAAAAAAEEASGTHNNKVAPREVGYMERPLELNMGPSLADVLLCTFESTNAGFSSFPVRKLLS